MERYNRNEPKPSTCDSTGSVTENANNNFDSIGDLENSTFADYWTKHHAAKHHQNIRKEFITPQIVLEMLRQRQTSNSKQQQLE